MAIITITQSGISSASSPGRSRSDGLSNGAQVSITSNTSVTMRFLWVPDEDTSAVSTQSPNSSTPATGWSFTPSANVYGSYLMEFSDGTRRIFAIRTPNAGLRIPALNETALTASLVSSSAGFVAGSDFNENSGSGPFSAGNYGGWYSAVKETIKAVDLTRGLISDNVFATVSGTSFTGPVSSSGGFTGSLQKINSTQSFLVGGTGIGITTQSNGQVVIRQSDYRTPQDFGALADDSHDDLSALQACSDFCIANQIPMYLPAGRYRTSGTWTIGSLLQASTIHISGVPGLPSHGLGSTIHCDAKGLPAIICQGLWWSVIENIGILGPNTEFVLIPTSSLSTYVSTGVSSSQWAPQCGLAIDVYNQEGVPMGQGYPGITYNTGSASSHNNTFTNLRIEGCVAAVWNAGGIGLASSMRFQQLYALGCAFGFCTSQTQARANEITNFAASFVHTMYDGRTFGAQNGSCPVINGAQEFTTTYRLLNVVTSFDPLRMEDVYAESLLTIGHVQGQHPAVFSECYFGMGDYDDTVIHGYMGAATTTFNGCFFHTREPYLNFLTLTTPSFMTFNSCHFTSRNDEQAYYYVNHKFRAGTTSTSLYNCNVAVKDVTGYRYFNTEIETGLTAQKLDISQWSRRIRAFGQGSIIGDGELRIIPSSRERLEKFAASGYSWSGGTLRFTAGTASEFMVNDILMWIPLTSASGGSPNLDVGIPASPDGDYSLMPMVKVTAVNGLSVTGSSIGLHTELSKSYAPSEVYIAQREWAPGVYVTASWTTSAPTITISPLASQMEFLPGDFIKADFGLAPNTRVVSQSALVLTINKNPLQTRVNEPIYFGKVVTSPFVVSEGETSIVSGTYRFLHSVSASGGLTGSLQRLPSGETYLAGGSNISIITQSNGQVVISAMSQSFTSSFADTALSATLASGLTSGSIPLPVSAGTPIPLLAEDTPSLKVVKARDVNGRGVFYTPNSNQFTVAGDGGLQLNGETFAGGTVQQGGGTTGQFTWRGNVRLTGDAGGTFGGAALFITRENTGELVQPLVDIYTGSVLNTPAVRITNSGTLLLTRRNDNSNPWEVDNGGGTRSQFGVSGSSTTPSNTGTPAGWISMTVSGTTAWMPYYL